MFPDVGNRRRVDMRGRSAQEQSRQDLLQKSRQERERRRVAKEQHKASAVIQACIGNEYKSAL